MQTLKDAASLAILILLVLTLRVDFGGEPVDLDLATPAEAAVETIPGPPAAPAEPIARPAATCSAKAAPLESPVLAPAGELNIDLTRIDDRTFVLERDGKRFVVDLGHAGPRFEIRTTTKTRKPCDATLAAHLSS